jgi:hypothetical protein
MDGRKMESDQRHAGSPDMSIRQHSFKQRDIQPCSICRKGLAQCGLPLFYRLTVERFGLDASAIRRQRGLEMMMGGHGRVAAALGPDEDMATPLAEPRTILICETCTHERPKLMIAFLGGDE